MANEKIIPKRLVDTLLHLRDTDRTEAIVFPITRYQNLLNAPQVVTDISESPGAPFLLMRTGKVDVLDDKIRSLCGDII